MNIYFDTEFTGLHKDTTLVSIGLVSDTCRSFYAEFSDYDKSYKDPWFVENVEKHLIHGTTKLGIRDRMFCDYVYGTKQEVANKLKEWLSRFLSVELVSDVCHYDMVLLIDLFGTAFDLPKNVSPVCHDINSDIARFCKITEAEAFDMNREELLTIINEGFFPFKENKHNSLYDADVIRAIHRCIESHEKWDKTYKTLKEDYEKMKEECGE